MVRAWRALDRFEGRAALRTWLYRIATNVCLDAIAARGRRARPFDLSSGPWEPVEASLGGVRPAAEWVEPMLDARVLDAAADPAEAAIGRESVRLLRDVLRWRAGEVAELLGTSTPAVNSALQRARATVGALDEGASEAYDPLDREQQELLTRYLAAFEAYDVDGLVELLHEDATQCMPPYEMWLRGRADIGAWMLGPGAGCRGSRLLPAVANGAPAFAQYKPSVDGGGHDPWALHVLDVDGGAVTGISSFLDVRLFGLLGLPTHLEEGERIDR
jgi:RNA polymerase sigma-70 factor (ECF subfamily)